MLRFTVSQGRLIVIHLCHLCPKDSTFVCTKRSRLYTVHALEKNTKFREKGQSISIGVRYVNASDVASQIHESNGIGGKFRRSRHVAESAGPAPLWLSRSTCMSSREKPATSAQRDCIAAYDVNLSDKNEMAQMGLPINGP